MEENNIDSFNDEIEYRTERNVDFVFCIDVSKRMREYLKTIKKELPDYIAKLKEEFANFSTMPHLRAKFVLFSNFEYTSKSIRETRFYSLETEMEEFQKKLAGILAFDPDDTYSSGFEALFYAMKSDFSNERKDLQYIMLFTNSDAKEIGKFTAKYYPKDMCTKEEFDEFYRTRCYKEKCYFSRNFLWFLAAPKGTIYEDLQTMFPRALYLDIDNLKKELEESAHYAADTDILWD